MKPVKCICGTGPVYRYDPGISKIQDGRCVIKTVVGVKKVGFSIHGERSDICLLSTSFDKPKLEEIISQLQYRLKQLEKQVKKPDFRWINSYIPHCPECVNKLDSKMVGDHIQYTCVNKDCDYIYKL